MAKSKHRRNPPDNQAGRDSRDIQWRNSIEVRASTANAEAGTVRATIATDNPVQMFDWRTMQIVDEVLLVAGCVHRDSHPMLDSHNRFSCGDVLGSVRGITPSGGTLDAELVFDLKDPEAVRVFNKVLGGHIRDISVGYRVTRKIDIPAGESRMVNGRNFVAGTRALRVATEWELFEASPTPVGADAASKIRSLEEVEFMNKRLLEYLRSLGLAADADEQGIAEFRSKLDGVNASIASLLNYPEGDVSRSKMADTAILAFGRDPADPAKERRSAKDSNAGGGAGTGTPPDAAEQARREGIAAEAARQRQIRQLATLCGEAVDTRTLDTALSESWTVERAQTHFTVLVENRRDQYAAGTAPRGGAQDNGDPNGIEGMIRHAMGPACHSLNREQTHSGMALSIALARRLGANNIQPHQWHFQAPEGGGRAYQEGRVSDTLMRDFDNSHRHAGLSLMDVAIACLRSHGQEPSSYSPVGVMNGLRASGSSTGTFSGVFSNAVYATLIQAYNIAMDPTGPITTEVDVKDFRTNELTRPETAVVLKRHHRGAKAQHIALADAVESFKIWPFDGQWKVDWQDMVDDRLNILQGMGPVALGSAARQLKPRLVAALFLENAVMRDGVAMFHANHLNYFTGVSLTAASAKQALTALAKMTENGEPIDNGGPVYFYVPPTLGWAAEQYRSGKISNDSGAGEENPLAGKYQVIQDARLELGVTHPTTDTVIAGSASTWYAVKAASLQQGVIIAYLLGMNRLPMVRSKVLDGGEWGMQWDVLHSIGGKFSDWRGAIKTT